MIATNIIYTSLEPIKKKENYLYKFGTPIEAVSASI